MGGSTFRGRIEARFLMMPVSTTAVFKRTTDFDFDDACRGDQSGRPDGFRHKSGMVGRFGKTPEKIDPFLLFLCGLCASVVGKKSVSRPPP